MYMSSIPFEVPCESNTQNAQNNRLKIGIAPWDNFEVKKTITASEDKDNTNFLHILFNSVIKWSSNEGVVCILGPQSDNELDHFIIFSYF